MPDGVSLLVQEMPPRQADDMQVDQREESSMKPRKMQPVLKWALCLASGSLIETSLFDTRAGARAASFNYIDKDGIWQNTRVVRVRVTEAP